MAKHCIVNSASSVTKKINIGPQSFLSRRLKQLTVVALTVVTNTRTDRHTDHATAVTTSRIYAFSACNAAAHHRICRSTASRSPVLTRGGICVPPTVTYLPYRVSRSTLAAVGRSHLLVRWPGTHSRILSGIQRAAQTVLGVYLKRT